MPTRTRHADGVTPTATAETLRFQILGPLRVWRDGVEEDTGPRQQSCLLALLLARVGRPMTMTDLIDLIWDDDAPASAVNVIHKYVGALRRLMEPNLPTRDSGSYLLRHRNGYRLMVGPDQLDLALFRHLLTMAKSSLSDKRRGEALDHYVQALRLWHGPAGDTFADGSAMTSIFGPLDREFLHACERATDLALSLRQPARVLAPLRLAASMAPLHEPVQASLMSALAATGQQAEALSVFRVVRSRLADDLGIDPGPALRDAHMRVLAQSDQSPMIDERSETDDEDVRPAGALPPLLPVRPAQLPPDLATFVGRSDELELLDQLFRERHDGGVTSPLIVALDGMGGVGKSTLATHFAHMIVPELPDGQLYLNLLGHESVDDRVSAGDGLRSLLSSLGASGADIPETMEARTATYRSLTAGKRILVVLDNVGNVEQVRPLLPNSAESLVLVTSRKPLVGLAAFDGAHLLHIDLPDMSSARALLRRRLERSPNRSATEMVSGANVLEEIITLCGRLPLALAILGGRLSARPRLSLATVAAELRDGARTLAAFTGGSGVSDPRAAFAWSYRQLSPEAARLFRLFSVTASPGVSAEACTSLAAQPPHVMRALLQELTEAALLDEDAKGWFSSHVLVKAYAQELFLAEEPPAEREAAISRLLQHYLHSSYRAAIALSPRRTPVEPPTPLEGVRPEAPGSYDEAMHWFENHVEVLNEALRYAAEVGIGILAWQLALTMQASLQWSGRFHDWQNVMQVALRAARESGDRIGEAHALRSLAGARHSFGDNEQAIVLLSEAQTIFQANGMLLEQALVHMNFHRVFSELGRHEQALSEHERSRALYRAAGCGPAEVWALEALGRSLAQLGSFDEARTALEAALALNHKVGRRTDEPEIRMHIAQCLMETGRGHEAVTQVEFAVQAARETKHKVDLFQTLVMLTEAYLGVANVSGAYDAWRKACDVMLSLQNGGTNGMRETITALGSRVEQAAASAPHRHAARPAQASRAPEAVGH